MVVLRSQRLKLCLSDIGSPRQERKNLAFVAARVRSIHFGIDVVADFFQQNRWQHGLVGRASVHEAVGDQDGVVCGNERAVGAMKGNRLDERDARQIAGDQRTEERFHR